jgi:hypothetical protein
MSLDDLSYKKDLLKAYQQRYRALELKRAQLGVSCPPEIIVEIDDIQVIIEKLQREIGSLRSLTQEKTLSMPKKILIVDDEEGMCLFLSEVLQDEGFEVITATKGLLGIQLAVELNQT